MWQWGGRRRACGTYYVGGSVRWPTRGHPHQMGPAVHPGPGGGQHNLGLMHSRTGPGPPVGVELLCALTATPSGGRPVPAGHPGPRRGADGRACLFYLVCGRGLSRLCVPRPRVLARPKHLAEVPGPPSKAGALAKPSCVERPGLRPSFQRGSKRRVFSSPLKSLVAPLPNRFPHLY